MPPRKQDGECTALVPRVCYYPITYSEHGHRLAGKYCDTHGLAIHGLRKGQPCNCNHCQSARKRKKEV